MPDVLTILLCDHHGQGSERFLETLAEREHHVEHTTSLRQSLRHLAAARPDLIVLLPLVPRGLVELETLDEARRGEPPVPLLVVSERGSGSTSLLAGHSLEGGPWDLIDSQAPREELLMRLDRLETELKRQKEMHELRHRAFHDDRTLLLRVGEFEKRLTEHFSAAQRHRFHQAFALIDLDDFGQINKLHDHTVGDLIIAQVGEVIRRTLRTEDVAGRLGGDEFGVLLPYTRMIDAARVIKRLLDQIHRLSGQPPGARSPIRVSASIGFETFDGADLDTVATLREHAERALREAKQLGGNRAVFYKNIVCTGS